MIHLGDAFDILPTIPDKSIDLVLTDPPFGCTDCAWDKKIDLNLLWKELRRVGKKNCAYVIHGIQPFTTDVICANRKWFRYCLVWVKDNSTGFLDAKRKPLRITEDIIVFYQHLPTYNPQMTPGKTYRSQARKQCVHYGKQNIPSPVTISSSRYPTTLLRFTRERGLHPTQKSLKLTEWLVATYSNEGETVLDPFCGSGTVGVACQNLNRHFIGVEKDPTYYETAKKRLEITPLANIPKAT